MPDNKRKGEIVELLRQADAELQQQRLSPEADQRLQQLIQGRRGRGWRPALLLVPLAAATAALLIWALAPPPQAPQRGRQELAGFSLVSGTVGRPTGHQDDLKPPGGQSDSRASGLACPRAGATGGSYVGNPRWARIFPMTSGSSTIWIVNIGPWQRGQSGEIPNTRSSNSTQRSRTRGGVGFLAPPMVGGEVEL